MKVAIVGTEPMSHGFAPWDDLSWEIWAMSGTSRSYPRVDRHYEVHCIEHLTRMYPDTVGEYLRHLNAHPSVRVLVRQKELPNAELINWPRLIERFGPYFFSSSVAWAAAEALSNPRLEAIGFFGIDCTGADEYFVQRSGVQYFIQKADEMKIPVVIPLESDLRQPAPIYGLREFDNQYRKTWVRQRDLQAKVNSLRQEAARLSDAISMADGMLEAATYDMRIWSGVNVTQRSGGPDKAGA